MAEEQYKTMDEIFRLAAETPGPPPSPEAWEKMNALLENDDKKRRRIFFWWWIPALMFISLVGYIYRVEITAPLKARPESNTSNKHVDKLKADPGSNEIREIVKSETNSNISVKPGDDEAQQKGSDWNQSNLLPKPKINNGIESGLTNERITDNTDISKDINNVEKRISSRAITDSNYTIQLMQSQINTEWTTLEPSTVILYTPLAEQSALQYPEKIKDGAGTNISPEKSAKADKTPTKALPFYLYGSIGPEVSGVNGKGKLRFGMGLGIGMKLSRSLFIQAGIINTNKVYSADGSHYYPKPGSYYDNENLKIQHVEADCNIIEIPLQIGMNIIQRKRNTIFVMGGITASIMRKEFYKYQYTRYGVPAESEYTYRTKSFEPVTSAGISVGYQRKINSRLVLQLNPYYNFPLNGIGEGRVEISSAGVLAGLRYNFKLFK